MEISSAPKVESTLKRALLLWNLGNPHWNTILENIHPRWNHVKFLKTRKRSLPIRNQRGFLLPNLRDFIILFLKCQPDRSILCGFGEKRTEVLYATEIEPIRGVNAFSRWVMVQYLTILKSLWWCSFKWVLPLSKHFKNMWK